MNDTAMRFPNPSEIQGQALELASWKDSAMLISAASFAKVLGTTSWKVGEWIRLGKLRAFRRGASRTAYEIPIEYAMQFISERVARTVPLMPETREAVLKNTAIRILERCYREIILTLRACAQRGEAVEENVLKWAGKKSPLLRDFVR